MTTKCTGTNCPSTDGQNHSPECRAEHAAAVAGGRFVKGGDAQDDLRALFSEAFDAGWNRSDECDNAYNNGTSEQLSVPPQAQEPQAFQEWRAEYFSDRDEVVTNLLARAALASTKVAGPTIAQELRRLATEHANDVKLSLELLSLANTVTLASTEAAAEPVAEIGAGWLLVYAGTDSLAAIVERTGAKIGDKLYTAPPPATLSTETVDKAVHKLTDEQRNAIAWAASEAELQGASDYSKTLRALFRACDSATASDKKTGG